MGALTKHELDLFFWGLIIFTGLGLYLTFLTWSSREKEREVGMAKSEYTGLYLWTAKLDGVDEGILIVTNSNSIKDAAAKVMVVALKSHDGAEVESLISEGSIDF